MTTQRLFPLAINTPIGSASRVTLRVACPSRGQLCPWPNSDYKRPRLCLKTVCPLYPRCIRATTVEVWGFNRLLLLVTWRQRLRLSNWKHLERHRSFLSVISLFRPLFVVSFYFWRVSVFFFGLCLLWVIPCLKLFSDNRWWGCLSGWGVRVGTKQLFPCLRCVCLMP